MSVMPVESLERLLQGGLYSPLGRLRRRVRLYLLVDGVFQLVLALVGGALVQFAIDRWLRLSLDQRAVFNSVLTLLWLWVLYRYVAVRLIDPLSDTLLASWVDRAHPQLHDQLSTAVEFAAQRSEQDEAELADRAAAGAAVDHGSPQLVDAVLKDACAVATRVRFLDVLNHRRSARRAIELAAILGLTILAATQFPWVKVWFARNWLLQDVPWPQRTHLEPEGFDAAGTRRVPRGDELLIAANIVGPVPDSAVAQWWTESGARGRETMTLIGDTRFEVSLGPISESVHFRLVGGDERTREYIVQAVEAPRVIRTRVVITPPAYANVAPITIEQQTVLEVLAGSALRIEAGLNKPIARGSLIGAEGLVLAGQQVITDIPGCSFALRFDWAEPVSGSYHVELTDRDGWHDRNPVRFVLKVQPDKPPTVKLQWEGVGEMITPQATLHCRLEVEDAFGLTAVSVHQRRNADPERSSPLPGFEPPTRRFQAESSLEVSELSPSPGDRLTVWVESADTDPAGPNIGRSPPTDVRVVSADEFMAEMARRELELRREFEQLVSAQRGIQDGLARALDELPPAALPAPALAQRLSGLLRQQASAATRCASFAERFMQVLEEMRTSKVARSVDERRLGQRLIEPLGALGRKTMPSAADTIASLRQDAAPALRSAATAAQDEILRQMRVVLANMLEWEGYNEAVGLLRELIGEQSDVHQETLKQVEKQLDDILGDLSDKPADNP